MYRENIILNEIADKLQSEYPDLNIISTHDTIYICIDIVTYHRMILIQNRLDNVDLSDPDLFKKLSDIVNTIKEQFIYNKILEEIYNKYITILPELTLTKNKLYLERDNTNFTEDVVTVYAWQKTIQISSQFSGLARFIKNPSNYGIVIV